jgi:PIN like domain
VIEAEDVVRVALRRAPEFFIDRSLGRHAVPNALRTAGVIVHTMAEVYGEQVGQGLADEDWLSEVGERAGSSC